MTQDDDSLKKEVKNLMRIKGETKGSEFISFAKYIQEKKGKEGVKAVEKKMEELGYPLHFDKVKEISQWYPENMNVLCILVAKHLFGWTKEDIFDFGYNSAKYSFLLKIVIKYFVSSRLVFEGAPKYWRKFLNVGELEAAEFNGEKRYLILRIKNYMFHPIMCDYFAGFFKKIAENSVKSENMKCEETKCPYQGGAYHEYVVSW